MRDSWGNDAQTGARGLLNGTRHVHGDGYVLIGGEMFAGPCLSGLRGKKVTVRVSDAWATAYSVSELETGKRIGDITVKLERSKP